MEMGWSWISAVIVMKHLHYFERYSSSLHTKSYYPTLKSLIPTGLNVQDLYWKLGLCIIILKSFPFPKRHSVQLHTT